MAQGDLRPELLVQNGLYGLAGQGGGLCIENIWVTVAEYALHPITPCVYYTVRE